MFRQLCGKEALKKVILVTTMWDKIPAEEGIKRERELIDTPDFWGWMLGKGSTCHRHNNTEDTARDIINLLAGHKAPITTDLQRQLVDENKSLDQTSAGIELQGEMLKEKAKWAQEKKEIEQQMRIAIQKHDREAEDMMREERDRYTRMIKKVENDTGALRSTMNNLLVDRDKRVAKIEKQMEEQQVAHKAKLDQINERQHRIEQEKEELEKQQRRREKEERQRRQREQEKQEEQRQIKEKEQEQARLRQRQVVVQAPKTEFAPYSLTTVYGSFMCIGPMMVTSNLNNPSRTRESALAAAVSLGEINNGARVWIVGYRDGTWVKSLDLLLLYPDLKEGLDKYGQNNLELCSLGPDGTYYARWRNGSWKNLASREINNKISEAHSDGKYVKAIALGYGGSYIISFGSTTSWMNLGIKWNLKGYYPGLQELLDANIKTTSIAAIALDMGNGNDYLMVYRDDRDDTKIKFRREALSKNNISRIDNWWLKS